MGKRYNIQIIIPMYNAQKTLEACLKSLQAQSYRAWQAIIIDDCSKDESYDLAMEYAGNDERIRVIRNEKNSGVSQTRNNALELLDSVYTAFIDSDDIWESDMLQVLFDEAQKGFDIVQCRYKYLFEGGRRLTPKGVFNKPLQLEKKDFKRVYFKMLTGINMNHVWGKLIRTELIKGERFDKTLKTAEDLDFCARLFLKAKNYSFIDKPLYNYYRGGISLTGGSLGFREKWKANAMAAKTIGRVMKAEGIRNPFYYMMVPLRIYIITISKIFRTFRDKVMKKRGSEL